MRIVRTALVVIFAVMGVIVVLSATVGTPLSSDTNSSDSRDGTIGEVSDKPTTKYQVELKGVDVDGIDFSAPDHLHLEYSGRDIEAEDGPALRVLMTSSRSAAAIQWLTYETNYEISSTDWLKYYVVSRYPSGSQYVGKLYTDDGRPFVAWNVYSRDTGDISRIALTQIGSTYLIFTATVRPEEDDELDASLMLPISSLVVRGALEVKSPESCSDAAVGDYTVCIPSSWNVQLIEGRRDRALNIVLNTNDELQAQLSLRVLGTCAEGEVSRQLDRELRSLGYTVIQSSVEGRIERLHLVDNRGHRITASAFEMLVDEGLVGATLIAPDIDTDWLTALRAERLYYKIRSAIDSGMTVTDGI